MINEPVEGATVPSQRRAFQMHINLLRDTITRQAGTIQKAVLEGVMNLIEAGATQGIVELTPSRLQISDNGGGFSSREEIIEAFEWFGKSDERAIAGADKKWAKFQQGRGQILSLGRTRYRTRTFAMETDIEGKGLGYDLFENLEDQAGCVVTVDFYEPLDVFEITETVKAIGKAVRYVDVPILLNGTQINEHPSSVKWQTETEYAYYRFNNSSSKLDVYNQGVFVCSLYDLGVGGTVVSRVPITLNTARNDIIRSCKQWQLIRKEFRQKTEKQLLDKKAFTADDAATVLAMIRNGEILYYQAASLRILRDTNNKPRSFRDLENKKVAFDKRGSTKADRAMQMNPKAIILDREYVSQVLGAGESDLNRLFNDAARYAQFNPRDASRLPTIVPVEELYVDLKGDATVLDETKLDKIYQTALMVLRDMAQSAKAAYSTRPQYSQHAFSVRHLKLGKSDTKSTWTDGRTYVVIAFEEFKSNIWSVSGWTKMLLDIASMYAFTTDDWTRDYEYYERFHDYAESFVLMNGKAFRAFTKAVIAKHPERAKRLRVEGTALAALEGRDFGDDDVAVDDLNDGLGEAR